MSRREAVLAFAIAKLLAGTARRQPIAKRKSEREENVGPALSSVFMALAYPDA